MASGISIHVPEDVIAVPTPATHKLAAAPNVATLNSTAEKQAWRENIRADDDDFTTSADGSRPHWFWTGPLPTPGTAGVEANGRITSLRMPELTATRQEVLEYFDNSWLLTEILFSGLQGTEAYYRPPHHNLRHPMIFYYGHPASFYVNKLCVAGLLQEPVNAYFEQIFEIGVDEMRWDDMAKNDMLWPKVREVTEYRRKVYGLVRNVIANSPAFGDDTPPVKWEDPEWSLFMAFEHERIHIETSSVLIREMPLKFLKEPQWWPAVHPELEAAAAPENPLVLVPAGVACLGKRPDSCTYGWDNEFGEYRLQVPKFEASKYQVTNAEFLEFVKAGGYQEEALWASEGWKWRTFRNAKWPTFWLPKGPAGLHEYDLRTIWHRLPLPLAAPVIVNSREARAFAAWRTRSISAPTPLRLLSEAEHHRLLGACGHAAAWAALPPPSGAALKARAAANLQLAYGAEVPVTVAGGAGPFVGVRGNVWHWCEDWMAALPGNRGFHPFYDDFSMPCYDGQHALIMGGSFMSTGSVATATARFHFRPHFHQHAGFRLARCFAPGTSPPLTHIDSPPPHVGSWNPSSRAASAAKPSSVLPQALLAAFQCKPPLAPPAGTPAAWLDFPAALVEVLRAAVSGRSDRKGHMLEVGCGVGGVAFKAAELFDSVMGIDLSADAIAAAQHLQSQGCLPFDVKLEGNERQAMVAELVVTSAAADKVMFKHMDPCSMAPDLGEYEVVIINSVLERCPSPKGVLSRMGGTKGLVKPGGLLLVLCSHDWQPEISDQSMWLAGRSDKSETAAAHCCQEALGPEFKLLSAADMPRLLHDHSRRFTVEVLEATVWCRAPCA